MAKFLDDNGLLYLWSKIKALVSGKVDKVDGKGLSTNDLTATLKTNYDAAYQHSQGTHAPTNAERNTIVGIQKNGADVTVDSNRKANITVPTKVSELTNDSGFVALNEVPSASASAAGLMSAADKAKLDGIEAGANAYELPCAGEGVHQLGGVKIGENIDIIADSNQPFYGQISVKNAAVGTKGVVALSDSVTSTATYQAATANAVKKAYDLANGKQSPATTLSGYGITDAYTKTEVDAKLTSAVRYMGTKASYSALPTSDNKTGDMWNITAADSAHGIKAGDNVVWNGSGWDVQSGTVDLSGCVQNADAITNAEIDTIVAS